jgi:hypothetical protein
VNSLFNRREGIMQSNSSVVLQCIEKVLNREEVDAAGEFFWEDMVEQVPLPGQGRQGGIALQVDRHASWDISRRASHRSNCDGLGHGYRPLGLMMQLGVVPPPKG